MENNILIIKKKDHMATLTINRPEKRNTLTPELLLQMSEAFDGFLKNNSVRTVIITGAGDKAFCAGYDLTSLTNQIKTNNTDKQKENLFDEVMEKIVNYPYPVIAMINGYTFGGGCDLAVSCDLRVASENVKMGMVPAKLGVVYSYKGLKRFIRVMGHSNVKKVFFTARTYNTTELKEFNLIDYIVPVSALKSFTNELATEISENAPLSLKGIKTIMNMITFSPISKEEEAYANQLVLESFESEDLIEGTSSFFEKRKAVFKGK